MRGRRDPQPRLFYAIDVEARIRPDHPLRPIKAAVDRILAGLSDRFAAAYSDTGRPGVPPERLVKALLLMALYSVRSERQLVERIDTDLLFRWFLDMSPGEPAFDATAFSHNRPRLDEHGLTAAFFQAVLKEALAAGLCSEHFSVDGTLIESYASLKSVRPLGEPKDPDGAPPAGGVADGNGFKPRNPDVDFHGQKRTNATHRSRTDPEARLYRKSLGQETKLRHLGHALGENRHGLIVGVAVTEANGTAEREAAVGLIDAFRTLAGRDPATVGLDAGYDSGELFLELETRGIEPHGALTKSPKAEAAARPNERDKVAARHRARARQSGEGYRLSQKCRKKLEEGFGWLKGVAGLARSRVVGRWKVRQLWELGAAAYNLVRMRSLLAIPGPAGGRRPPE
jgi:transposase